jgi:hypothetical protein
VIEEFFAIEEAVKSGKYTEFPASF